MHRLKSFSTPTGEVTIDDGTTSDPPITVNDAGLDFTNEGTKSTGLNDSGVSHKFRISKLFKSAREGTTKMFKDKQVSFKFKTPG